VCGVCEFIFMCVSVCRRGERNVCLCVSVFCVCVCVFGLRVCVCL